MIVEDEWDVIISGAGPGGSLAAYKLALAGLKVLLLERRRLPRDKTCSGILSQPALKILEKELQENVPEGLCVWPHKGKGLKVFMPQAKDFSITGSAFFNVYRRDFDYWLNLKASSRGVTLWSQAELISLVEKEGLIEVKVRYRDHKNRKMAYKDLKSNSLIAAEGGNSRVRKILYPNEKQIFAFAYQEYWTGEMDLDPEYFHAFFLPRLASFYNWCNQKEDLLIVGTGAIEKKTLLENQEKFIKYLKDSHGLQLGKKIRTEACYQGNLVVSRNADNYKLGRGRVLLIGEAAGFLDILGEGIPVALKSGKEAANAIIESKGEDLLDIYQDKIKGMIKRLIDNYNMFKENFNR